MTRTLTHATLTRGPKQIGLVNQLRVDGQLSPVEGVGLRYGSVQTAGGPVTDQLEQKHDVVTHVLVNRQVHALPRLGGNLDDRVAYPGRRQIEKKLLNAVKVLKVPKTTKHETYHH